MKALAILRPVVAAVVIGGAAPVCAQEAEITLLDPPKGASAEAYDAQNRWTNAQTSLAYVDTLVGEIPMDGAPAYRKPPPEPDIEPGSGEVNPVGVLFLTLVLALLAVLLWKFGGPARALFGRTPTEGARAEMITVPTDASEAMPHGLAAFRSMADRETALVLMVQEALTRAARANDLRVRRSETARETLRRLPRAWPLRDNLRQIVMAEELVQFGGRALTDDIFEACLQNADPIWRAA